LADHVQIEVGRQYFVFIARGLGDNLSARITKITRAIEFSDVPRRFHTYAVDRSNVVAIRHRVRRLLDLPQVLAETGDGGRRVEHDLGAVESQGAGAFGKVAIIADVNSDLREADVEHRIAQVPGTEVEFFPKSGSDVRNVGLAIFPQIRAVRAEDGGRVVED